MRQILSGNIEESKKHGKILVVPMCFVRTDLREEEIVGIYKMLTEVEEAFRSLKSELGLRPAYHQKEHRCDGHLFISVLAYHLLHGIRMILQSHGIVERWSTIRDRFITVGISTKRMETQEGRIEYVRSCNQLESYHKQIYDALGLPYCPIKSKKLQMAKK